MARIGMCSHCRQSKQKCTPIQRTWVDGGVNQKCDKCSRYDHPCGPNVLPPRQPPRRRRSPPQQQALSPLPHQAIPPPSAGPSMTGPLSREVNNAPAGGLLDFAEDDAGIGDEKQKLRLKLADLDDEAEVHKQLQLGIEYLERDQRRLEPHYTEMTSRRNASTHILSSKLGRTEALADGVRDAHEVEAAENAYTKILAVYHKMDVRDWEAVHRLLLKIANISWKIGASIRTENLLWEALELGGIQRQAQETDLRLLKNLAKSLPRTSKEISKVAQNLVTSPISSVPTMLFPPLQRMMESKYASDLIGNVFQTAPIASAEGADLPIIGGLEAIEEVLRNVPEADLLAADSFGRTPLFMATDLQKEPFGLGLLLYAAKLPSMPRRKFTNSRDVFGQTTLGIAAWRRCSSQYMEALINYGAEVDPETLVGTAWTPLQIASGCGYSEIVDLLLSHGAEPGRIWPGTKTPETLAQEAGHDGIVLKLQSHLAGG